MRRARLCGRTYEVRIGKRRSLPMFGPVRGGNFVSSFLEESSVRRESGRSFCLRHCNGKKRMRRRISVRLRIRLQIYNCSERPFRVFRGFGHSVRFLPGDGPAGIPAGNPSVSFPVFSCCFRHFFRPISRTSSPPHKTAEVAPMTSPQSRGLSGTVRTTSPPHVTMANCPTRINASTPKKA